MLCAVVKADKKEVIRMSIQMNVRPDEYLEAGSYKAKLLHLEKVRSTALEWLAWTFLVLDLNIEVESLTLLSESPGATPFRWAQALNPEIATKQTWSSKDVLGRKCILVVKANEGYRTDCQAIV
jgi:hypothetical protein